MIKSNLKTVIKKFEAAVSENNKDSAVEAFKLVVKKIDQATAKGILHKNTASRKKARLAAKLNAVNA